jgi:hypothetical protein
MLEQNIIAKNVVAIMVISLMMVQIPPVKDTVTMVFV